MDSRAREDLLGIFRAALAAVDPEEAVRRHVRRSGTDLIIGDLVLDLSRFDKVFVLGAGKGTAPMAKALEEVLGDFLSEGAIVVKTGHGLPLQKVRVLEAAHPVPDAQGVEATKELLRLADHAGERDLVLVAVSGGGSALTPAPVAPLTLEHKQKTTELLLSVGATIQEINAVRKHLSQFKGGGLARAAAPAQVVTLIVSDVIGDPLDVIASGPTAPDSSTYRDAMNVIERYHLQDKIPACVIQVLREGLEGRRPETPKSEDAVFRRVSHVLVANNATAMTAAAQEARQRGYHVLVLTSCLEGEAREVAKVIAAVAKEVVVSGRPVPLPACLLLGGETTVTLGPSPGKGGRNQELALAAALALDGWPQVTVLSAGTDGTDGPTDAAGAFADGTTVVRSAGLGWKVQDTLDGHNAYPLFEALGDLVITGPTRTNVMDLIGVLIA
ncbi:glycerate kinase type-2 family protein [Desulfosoma caldarium]|uniref:Glycerate 2-kinase n=1 Tax=Desulfosoma caldarium TaxID=610254 RepID=A0A3N1UU64_9BACT|nr:glycerate kinase [Desulfosoma caldarium]ROQ92087.1 glycerate 2-kinase [Desulfosoma caldarium]